VKTFCGSNYGEHFKLKTVIACFGIVGRLAKVSDHRPWIVVPFLKEYSPDARCARISSVSAAGSYKLKTGSLISSSLSVLNARTHIKCKLSVLTQETIERFGLQRKILYKFPEITSQTKKTLNLYRINRLFIIF